MAARKIARREWTKSDVRELKSMAKKVPARQYWTISLPLS
jgi:hypothetical protein